MFGETTNVLGEIEDLLIEMIGALVSRPPSVAGTIVNKVEEPLVSRSSVSHILLVEVCFGRTPGRSEVASACAIALFRCIKELVERTSFNEAHVHAKHDLVTPGALRSVSGSFPRDCSLEKPFESIVQVFT